ncbi:MAG: PQQ-binding-like beta-propeller repeat protein, partial [Planctomycetes bacterium]|nr:PQQ-binding-like beta-propeller repeat protein [Planctomycetota bacterium]
METKRIRVAAVALLIVTFVCIALLKVASPSRELPATVLSAARLQRGPAYGQIGNRKSKIENPSDWPEFRGPGRTNISADKSLLKKWPEGGPRRLWTYSQCGKGYSGVVIADGMIFTVGDFGREEIIVALDMNGNMLWKSPNGDAWRGPSLGSRSAPTYSDGALYHMNPSGRLAAYEARSGKPIWVVDLKSRFDARYGIWAMAEHVIVDGDKVLCMPGGPRGRVVALDKRTGKTIWANTEIEHSAAYCSGVVVTHEGVRQLISLTQRSVVGVNVENGAIVGSTDGHTMQLVRVPFAGRDPGEPLALRELAFSQLCSKMGAPASYVRGLPAKLQIACMNWGMTRQDSAALLRLAGGEVRAVLSDR